MLPLLRPGPGQLVGTQPGHLCRNPTVVVRLDAVALKGIAKGSQEKTTLINLAGFLAASRGSDHTDALAAFAESGQILLGPAKGGAAAAEAEIKNHHQFLDLGAEAVEQTAHMVHAEPFCSSPT